MLFRYIAFSLLTILATGSAVTAQETDSTETNEIDIRKLTDSKVYFSSGTDAALFQSSIFSRPGRSSGLSTLRFSYVINMGLNLNFDASKHFSVYAGVNIKNIGFIDKIKDSTVKHRVYTVGIPVGFRIGNLLKRNYIVLGGGVDFPFNYREKGFIQRGHKQKFNEWFSDRTETVMPYLFAGFSVNPGLVIKAQYYLSNFMNPDYTQGALKPYAGYDTHLIMIGVGYDIHYKHLTRYAETQKKAIKNVM